MPTPPTPATASSSTFGTVGGGDHRPHSRPRGDRGRRDLRRHAAAAPRRARAAHLLLEGPVDPDDLLDQRRVRVEARIGGEHARGVGEQHEQVGVHEVGDERGEAVVVAEADLVVGDGVVLVHDRDHAELEQAHQRLPGVQVLTALDEVVRDEQHLRGHETVRREDVVVGAHEAALTDRGERLQRRQVDGPLGQAERGDPGRHGARGDDDDVVAVDAQLRDLVTELLDRGDVDRHRLGR